MTCRHVETVHNEWKKQQRGVISVMYLHIMVLVLYLLEKHVKLQK